MSLRLAARHNSMLLGVSRQGRQFRDRIRHLKIRAGDILLLSGAEGELPDVVGWMGCLPLAERGLVVIQRKKAWLAMGCHLYTSPSPRDRSLSRMPSSA